jgi:tetratricopeptide (TPR) repeat protein
VYSVEQAVQYLVDATGIHDRDAAELVAKDLGRLPLAVTQAAEVIKGRGYADFSVYRDALKNAGGLGEALHRPDGDPYKLAVDAALKMGYRDAVDACCRISDAHGEAALAVLQSVSVLSESGVPRVWLSVLGDSQAVVQDAVGVLVARHVMSESDDRSEVSLHGLTSRVIREDRLDEDLARMAIAVLAGVNVEDDSCDYMERRSTVAALGAQLVAVHSQPGSGGLLNEPDLLAVAGTVMYAADELKDPYTAISLSVFQADFERVLGADHPDTLTSRNNLAYAYESAGDLGRAIPLYAATLADRERVLGADHPDTLLSRNNLAYAYRSAGDLGRAIPLLEATLADCERVLGADHPSTLLSRNNLAGAYESAGDLGKAIPLLEATLADRERVLGADHPDTLLSRNNLAHAYESAGDLGRAIPLYAATLADRERVLGADHPSTLLSRNNLAVAYHSAGDLGKAIPLFEATLADCERVLGADHPVTVTVHNNLERAREGL